MKNILIFGAGMGGKLFIKENEKTKEYNILAIIDNDEKKHGQIILGYKIIGPKEISRYEYDQILIASMYILDIKEQLVEELKVQDDKIGVAPKKPGRPFEHGKTLELARELLIYITQLMNNNRIIYFADFGTLLGLARDGDIIPWDDDIDFCMNEDELALCFDLLRDKLLDLPGRNKIDWILTCHYDGENKLSGLTLSFDEEVTVYKYFHLTINRIRYDGNKAIRSMSFVDKKHFTHNEYIKYGDYRISVPNEYKKMLESTYGNWERPKKDTQYNLEHGNYVRPLVTKTKIYR